MLDPTTTPSCIVRQLDQYVIGQDGAKKTVAVAVYLFSDPSFVLGEHVS